MRLSRYFLPVLRETPKEAEIVSHQLMLRAGMVRQASAGIYSWLPLGFRVLKKIEQIVREEQNRSGAIEVLMPTHPVGGPVARERALRRLRPGNAAHQGPARARHALRAHQRGADHPDLPRRREVLPRPAAQPLSHPMEVPRRGAPALRRDARPRVPDEGRLFLRPDAGGGAACLQQDVRRLSAHLRAHGAEIHSHGGRDGPHRRRSQPRVHHPGRDGREQGVLPRRPDRDCACPAPTSISMAIWRP